MVLMILEVFSLASEISTMEPFISRMEASALPTISLASFISEFTLPALTRVLFDHGRYLGQGHGGLLQGGGLLLGRFRQAPADVGNLDGRARNLFGAQRKAVDGVLDAADDRAGRKVGIQNPQQKRREQKSGNDFDRQVFNGFERCQR